MARMMRKQHRSLCGMVCCMASKSNKNVNNGYRAREKRQWKRDEKEN